MPHCAPVCYGWLRRQDPSVQIMLIAPKKARSGPEGVHVMASLVKRGNRWSVRICENGKERWRSLATTDRQEAVRKARELEAAVKGSQWLRRLLQELLTRAENEVEPSEAPLLCESVADGLRRLLELVPVAQRDALALTLSRRLVESQQSKLDIAAGWEAWLASPNRSTSPKTNTLRSYHSIWDQFASWCKSRPLRWFHELDEAAAIDYGAHLWKQGFTPRTFNAHVQFLRSAWNTLRVQAGLSEANPWGALRTKAANHNTGRRDLTPDEIRAIISRASGALRLLLLAGTLTGARLGDIVSMRWEDLDLITGTWKFIPMKTSRTGKRLETPLLEPLLGALQATQKESLSPWVFPHERSLWARGDINRVISKHFEECGIVTTEPVAKNQQRQKARVVVGFHSLRHSAATLAAKSGVNLALVQKTLGHSTAGMTAHYTHTDQESARQVLAPLAAILNLPVPAKASATA